jgi:VCBS repeat protein
LLPAAKYNDTIVPVSISAADLNGDGFLDLLSAGDMGGFTVLINRGDGNFDLCT